jgi:geranylgeranyl transferase type-2 subunit alpha
MESLLHYKRLLLQNHIEGSNPEISTECQTLLKQLEEIDPLRRQRYHDLSWYLDS